MKKKTKIIILIIVLMIMVLVPVGISASRGLIIVAKSDEEIAQANKEENERALAEKANFANTHSTNGISTQSDDIDEVDIPLLDEELAKDEEEEQKLVEIIRRFYPNEFDEALAESKNEQDTGMIEITSSPLKDYEKTIYDLVLKILENENLTEEETNLLKDYINVNMYNIKKDEDLQARAEKILEQ